MSPQVPACRGSGGRRGPSGSMSAMKSFRVLGLAGILVLGAALPVETRQDQALDLLRTSEAPANAIWIDSLDLTKMVQRRQTPRAGQTLARGRGAGRGRAAGGGPPAASPLTLGGVVYPHGIGTLSINELIIDLKGQATRFVAMVGLDDLASREGSVNVEV